MSKFQTCLNEFGLTWVNLFTKTTPEEILTNEWKTYSSEGASLQIFASRITRLLLLKYGELQVDNPKKFISKTGLRDVFAELPVEFYQGVCIRHTTFNKGLVFIPTNIMPKEVVTDLKIWKNPATINQIMPGYAMKRIFQKEQAENQFSGRLIDLRYRLGVDFDQLEKDTKHLENQLADALLKDCKKMQQTIKA